MEKLKSLIRLEEALHKLPAVGKKSASRMAYALLDMSDEDVEELGRAILELKGSIKKCPICGNYSENDICDICSDEERDRSVVVVVSYPKDVLAFENSESYKGLYHVLNGVISPLKGKGVEDINLDALLHRLEKGEIKEVILATNPTAEGEATALYIAKRLEGYDVNVSRLAYGLQMGGQLEYVDALTLARALEGRRKI